MTNSRMNKIVQKFFSTTSEIDVNPWTDIEDSQDTQEQRLYKCKTTIHVYQHYNDTVEPFK